MALETRYIVGEDPEHGYPVINRSILVDGVEVSSSDAYFKEVAAAYPQIVEEYFDAVAAWLRQAATFLDGQTNFTAENFEGVRKVERFVFDFSMKFDYLTIVAPDTVQVPTTDNEEMPVTE
jgi:hypothetical protein